MPKTGRCREIKGDTEYICLATILEGGAVAQYRLQGAPPMPEIFKLLTYKGRADVEIVC
jgi:hypothetical protein